MHCILLFTVLHCVTSKWVCRDEHLRVIMIHYNMLLFLISCSFKLKMIETSSQQQVCCINSKLKTAPIQSPELNHELYRSLYCNTQHVTVALVRRNNTT